MSHGLKLLLIAAGAIITCIVVVIGFQLTQSGKYDANQAKEQFSGLTSNYDDVELAAYDSVTISGAEVADCIQTYEDLLLSSTYAFTIEVITSQNIMDAGSHVVTGVVYGDVDADYEDLIHDNTSISKSTTKDYINPKGKFMGAVSRNGNGVINKITFTQQK